MDDNPEDDTRNTLEPGAEQNQPSKKGLRQLIRNKRFLIAMACFGVVAIGLVLYLIVGDKSHKTSRVRLDTALSLAETAYTGVEADVLTNQTFDCAPRNDHEWYRTDQTLVVDHKDPNVMYVNVEYKGLFKTIDGGKTWLQKTKGIKVYARSANKTKGCYGEYPVIRMDPSDSKHLILGLSGSGGGFLNPTTPNSQTGGVYQTYDGGETWKLMINDKMNIYVTDVAIDKSNPQTVYYGTASNPASYSEADQNKLFVTKGLIYKTADSGASWEELPTGIGNRTGATAVLVNPANGKEIVASTYSAVRQSADGTGTGLSSGKDTSVGQLGILKSVDGGVTWTKIQLPGNPAIMRGYASPTNFQHMFFGPQSTGKPAGYVTLDGGATFRRTTNMDVIVYDPHDPSGNHVLGYNTVAGTPTIPSLNLFESNDGGVSWKAHKTLPKEIQDLNGAKTRPSNIVWHPADKNVLLMSGAGGHVWKTKDFGQSWTKLLDYTMLPN